MTKLVIARRSGITRSPDGTQYRIDRGRTLADARHPAVVQHPQDWQEIEVALAVPDTDLTPEGPKLADLQRELGEAEAEVQTLTAELMRIVAALDERKLIPTTTDRKRSGWLVAALVAALDSLRKPAAATAVPAPLADPETADGRATIRLWAISVGIDVAEKGQLPKSVIERYREAHGATPSR